MSDLVESLAYAVELADNEEKVIEANGKMYYDRNKHNLTELDGKKYADTLSVSTLQGLVDFIKAKFDRNGDRLVLHVKNPTTVNVLSQLDESGKRENMLTAVVDLPVYPFGKFLKPSDFIIMLQSIFKRNEDAQALLEFTGVIKIDNGIELKDNGITQTTIVKSGAATVAEAKVPSPATLQPYRTFLEVPQPESAFIFRLDEKGNCTLFEADGGLWKNEAISNVRKYLEVAFKDEIEANQINIIA